MSFHSCLPWPIPACLVQLHVLLHRTLLQRMGPLFAKSGLRFECDMVDTVTCQRCTNQFTFQNTKRSSSWGSQQ